MLILRRKEVSRLSGKATLGREAGLPSLAEYPRLSAGRWQEIQVREQKTCDRKFNVLIGTIYENTKIPLSTWFAAIYLCTAHKKGISSCQLAGIWEQLRKRHGLSFIGLENG